MYIIINILTPPSIPFILPSPSTYPPVPTVIALSDMPYSQKTIKLYLPLLALILTTCFDPQKTHSFAIASTGSPPLLRLQQTQNAHLDIEQSKTINVNINVTHIDINSRIKSHQLATKLKKRVADKRKKKKKKKTKHTIGPILVQQSLFCQPSYDPQSLPGFSLQPFSTPWRHQMIYSLTWETSPEFLNQIVAAQRGLFTQTKSKEKTLVEDTGIKHIQKDACANFSKDNISILWETLTMDFHLVPFDPIKSDELLLSRVPISSGKVEFKVRIDIPPEWYRLQIRFWNEQLEPLYHRSHLWTVIKDSLWSLASSYVGYNRTSSNKQINTSINDVLAPRQVGTWRGEEAIEVTSLSPEMKEWDEFIQTVSHEVQEEKWSIKEFIPSTSNTTTDESIQQEHQQQQQRQKQQQQRLEEHRSKEEFRISKLVNNPPPSPWCSWINMFAPKPSSITPPASLPLEFQRSQFSQESFRFKDTMNVIASRDSYPDFQEDEIQEMEEETEEAKKQGLAVPQISIIDTATKAEVETLLEIWGKTSEMIDDDSLEQNEEYGSVQAGHPDLHILIENGKEAALPNSYTSWRANRDRIVSWKVSRKLIHDRVLFTVELVKAPKLSLSSSLTGFKKFSTRAEMIQQSLQQPRTAVLTDHVPSTWGAIIVRMPTWVLSGPYQIRLQGLNREGIKWADVSQPFAVQSDPFLYA
ncbi:hypothetical protein BX616_010233 [Lobosporangium transversale]|uniref:Uncharacterized protein n=1 Tax=Lobosporangium transversale TaxID=64571 RepID=A0A1Y2GB66_9FUNG|nr:hypothetical protein BCR41DRAFT_400251 [Lobosporangium transversale]KAF9912768.1 hypothetical protein BX616_010233 [Lobosporangium transversale]ORZ06109.1 hypothetical protein BCR41DRAFT_400251 [Lobosporangium transversale]|eukprot:XP_021877378.1 hypothetical protein BCR41DRAFT_400251 [Lobosporangium transversale]